MDEKRRNYQRQYRQDYKQKTQRVNLTLSKDEYRAFSRAAGNTRLTAYVKELALAGLHQQAAIPESLQAELNTLRFAIRNIANNVNQMAHYSHTVRSMTLAEENNLFQHLKQLDEAVQAFTEQRIVGDSTAESSEPKDESDDH